MATASLVIYNLLLFMGLLMLWPIWVGYLVLVPKARAGFWEKLGIYSPAIRARLKTAPPEQKRVWFHAVSVGEFNAIRPLVTELMTESSDAITVIISCTTRTGHDLAQKTFPQLSVLYFPFDFRAVLERALALVKPDLVVLTETELWPNFIQMVSQQAQVPLILINGRLSPRSFKGYQRIQFVMQPCLQQITHLYMQALGDAERIQALGQLPPERITVAGNLKFDLNPTLDPVKVAHLRQLLNIQPNDTILTLASTHSGEDLPLIRAYQKLKQDFPELKLILAPRHPERVGEIRGILQAQGLQFSVRSELSEAHPNAHTIVVLDSIGELLTVYSFSTIAVMGGSFIERGGQNPLEALSQRVPVLFGPHMHNFSAISRMVLESEAGVQVPTAEALVPAITTLLTHPEQMNRIATNGLQLLENNRGAKALLSQAIRKHLRASSERLGD